jgi:aspartyl-tRNA(Asn)/glutamyl-tRNA(Gln) amidotransferase subunit C
MAAGEIDHAQVQRIAKLARLTLTDAEVEQFAGQLGDILTYFHKIDEVDTTGVEPLAHPHPVRNVLREDVPRTGLTNAQALQNAPQRVETFFKVPKVLDQGA